MIFSYLFASCHGDSLSRSHNSPTPCCSAEPRPCTAQGLRGPSPLCILIFSTSKQDGSRWVWQKLDTPRFRGEMHHLMFIWWHAWLQKISNKTMCWMSLKIFSLAERPHGLVSKPWDSEATIAFFLVPATGTDWRAPWDTTQSLSAGESQPGLCYGWCSNFMMGWGWMVNDEYAIQSIWHT